MTKFKKAVKTETELPKFDGRDGHRFVAEWDAWVGSQGKHALLKRHALYRGAQVSNDIISR